MFLPTFALVLFGISVVLCLFWNTLGMKRYSPEMVLIMCPFYQMRKNASTCYGLLMHNKMFWHLSKYCVYLICILLSFSTCISRTSDMLRNHSADRRERTMKSSCGNFWLCTDCQCVWGTPRQCYMA